MTDEVKWIKLSTGILDDEKIIAIEEEEDGSSLCWLWIKLLALAGKQNNDGCISLTEEIPYTRKQLANRFRMSVETIEHGLQQFQEYGMIEIIDDMIYTSNWLKYQNQESLERMREKNREYVRKHREKKKALEEAAASAPMPQITDDKSPMDRRFERFWQAYPRKVGKGNAEKSFKKYKPDDALTNRMIAAVEACKRTDQWKKDGGQFIPHPATWLNQRRWEDEVETEELPFTDPPEPSYIRDESIEDWN